MTVLFEQSFPNTLADLVTRLCALPAGSHAEAWTFDDRQARMAAAATLRERGITATFRSAYKPLLHYILEEAGPAPLTIHTPKDDPRRWRLEAYPLGGLREVHFMEGWSPLHYIVVQNGQETPVFAPNRQRTDPTGQSVLTPCGWLRITSPELVEDAPLETAFEQVFAAAMATIAAQPWHTPPFFDTLLIEATLPGIEQRIPYGDEAISTTEALHEDLYFSILEWAKHRAGLPPADRTMQPGRIVPDIRHGTDLAHLRISLAPIADRIQPGPTTLEDADRPLTPLQIEREFAALGGETFRFASVQGRPIEGAIFEGTAAPILLSAGQHANETASVVGALRAMQSLRHDGQIAFIPMENPDGHALHHTLRAENPRHMLHAARYTALGDDLESRQKAPWYEKAARLHAIATTGAKLHINLHGYPSHEWTRPLSGYLPRGFELWTIPKGFFLILRHRPGLAESAMAFVQALAAEVALDADLRAFNETQLKTWEIHAGAFSFPVFHAIPCLVSENPSQSIDYTLITEYPDETIYGDAFRLAHRTQLRTTLAAVRLYRERFAACAKA
jgi:hypothetical protein